MYFDNFYGHEHGHFQIANRCLWTCKWWAAILGYLLCPAALWAQPSAVPAPASAQATTDAQQSERQAILSALEESYPDRPEWVDMLVDILQDSQMGPTDGWFRRAQAQTRFDWSATQQLWDRDDDQTVTESEFPGRAADFRRLDRNRDQVLTAADFDFAPHALTPTMGAMLFQRWDRDGNGKVTPAELEQFFQACDSEQRQFLCLNDLEQVFQLPAPPRQPTAGEKSAAANLTASNKSGGPTKATLIRGLFLQEIGSLQPGPALNEPAPDFLLPRLLLETGPKLKADADQNTTPEMNATIRLSELIGTKPVVLVFGNFTCGPFRTQSGNVEKLYLRYRDRANLLMVYVREAHPTDGWRMLSNDRVAVALPQPQNDAERMSVAQTCQRVLDLEIPMVVDGVGDAVGALYSGMPSRLYLIDLKGRVAYKSGRGPFGFKPAELEHALLLLLNQTATDSIATNPNPDSTPANSSPTADSSTCPDSGSIWSEATDHTSVGKKLD